MGTFFIGKYLFLLIALICILGSGANAVNNHNSNEYQDTVESEQNNYWGWNYGSPLQIYENPSILGLLKKSQINLEFGSQLYSNDYSYPPDKIRSYLYYLLGLKYSMFSIIISVPPMNVSDQNNSFNEQEHLSFAFSTAIPICKSFYLGASARWNSGSSEISSSYGSAIYWESVGYALGLNYRLSKTSLILLSYQSTGWITNTELIEIPYYREEIYKDRCSISELLFDYNYSDTLISLFSQVKTKIIKDDDLKIEYLFGIKFPLILKVSNLKLGLCNKQIIEIPMPTTLDTGRKFIDKGVWGIIGVEFNLVNTLQLALNYEHGKEKNQELAIVVSYMH